jgi:hypothetical protein
MGQVTISFLGVCTIFRNLPALATPEGLPPGTPIPSNRVVLARTTTQFLEKNPSIDRHIAILQMPPYQLLNNSPALPPLEWFTPDTYKLDGVQLSIPNATQTKLKGCLCCLPSLQEHLDQPLGPPAPWVYLPDRERVQAWFDITGGNVRARLMSTDPPCPTIPSITLVTINTDGAPILQYQPFPPPDGPAEPPTQVELTSLSPNVNVMNFANGEALVDDNSDFLLNYTLAETMPPDSAVRVPRKNRCTKFSRITYFVGGCGDAGPGCSNTGFP